MPDVLLTKYILWILYCRTINKSGNNKSPALYRKVFLEFFVGHFFVTDYQTNQENLKIYVLH